MIARFRPPLALGRVLMRVTSLTKMPGRMQALWTLTWLRSSFPSMRTAVTPTILHRSRPKTRVPARYCHLRAIRWTSPLRVIPLCCLLASQLSTSSGTQA